VARILCTLHGDQYTFLIISRPFLLRIRNVWDKRRREDENTHFVLSNVFFSFRKSCSLWDNVGKILQSGAGHRWKCGACALHAAYVRLHIHTHTHKQQYVILLFRSNNGCTNAYQCYFIRTLPVWLALVPSMCPLSLGTYCSLCTTIHKPHSVRSTDEQWVSSGVQSFQRKCRNSLKILGTRRVTWKPVPHWGGSRKY